MSNKNRNYNKYLTEDLFPSKTLLDFYFKNEIDIT